MTPAQQVISDLLAACPNPGAEPETVRKETPPIPSGGRVPVTTIPVVPRGSQLSEALKGRETLSASTVVVLDTSKPELELVAHLMAAGKSRKEIAAMTGLTLPTIHKYSQQPYVRQRVRDLLKEHGGNDIKAFLSTQVSQCLDTLVEIRDDPGARAADRLSATNALLDRALGKPVQHIETAKVDVVAASTEISDLQAKIAANTLKLRAMGVSTPN